MNEMEWESKYNDFAFIGCCLLTFVICVLITIFKFNWLSLACGILFGFAGIYMLFAVIFNYYKRKRSE